MSAAIGWVKVPEVPGEPTVFSASNECPTEGEWLMVYNELQIKELHDNYARQQNMESATDNDEHYWMATEDILAEIAESHERGIKWPCSECSGKVQAMLREWFPLEAPRPTEEPRAPNVVVPRKLFERCVRIMRGMEPASQGEIADLFAELNRFARDSAAPKPPAEWMAEALKLAARWEDVAATMMDERIPTDKACAQTADHNAKELRALVNRYSECICDSFKAYGNCGHLESAKHAPKVPEGADTIGLIIRDVCELEGYTSPDGAPNLLQCTDAELRTILETRLAAAPKAG